MKSASLQWILGPIPHEGITHGNIFMFHEQNEVYRIMFMVIDFNGPFNINGISPSRPIMVVIFGQHKRYQVFKSNLCEIGQILE
jgi:hypothetical protein